MLKHELLKLSMRPTLLNKAPWPVGARLSKLKGFGAVCADYRDGNSMIP